MEGEKGVTLRRRRGGKGERPRSPHTKADPRQPGKKKHTSAGSTVAGNGGGRIAQLGKQFASAHRKARSRIEGQSADQEPKGTVAEGKRRKRADEKALFGGKKKKGGKRGSVFPSPGKESIPWLIVIKIAGSTRSLREAQRAIREEESAAPKGKKSRPMLTSRQKKRTIELSCTTKDPQR